ncbi:MAG: response regulator transcription factor [Chloroflexi bacterium]|nr:MAG: response regulator transcription factor [Chloroflexota bacterium]
MSGRSSRSWGSRTTRSSAAGSRPCSSSWPQRGPDSRTSHDPAGRARAQGCGWAPLAQRAGPPTLLLKLMTRALESTTRGESRHAVSTVRVLTVDDHASFRSTARALVAATEGFEVAGEVATGEEAVAAVERLHPDLVLMDVRLPGIDGYEATRQISRIRPEVVVVLVSAVDDHASFRSTARALVAATEGFEVAGEVATGEEAVAAVERLHPDRCLRARIRTPARAIHLPPRPPHADPDTA